MIVTYQQEDIPFVWQEIEPLIERYLERIKPPNLDKETLYDRLRCSKCQLWTWQDPKLRLIVITEIYSKKCCLVVASGEHLRSCQEPFFEGIRQWAKSIGCKSMTIRGRKGWSRLLNFKVRGMDGHGLYIMEKQI